MFTLTELREAIMKSDMEEGVKSDLLDILTDGMGYDEIDFLFDQKEEL